MTRTATIRVATIGTSTITERFADAVRAADAGGDGIRIDVAFSRDAARGRAFADRIGVPRTATDLDALVRSGDIDAVYVGSPNGVHAEQARRAIAAGVHVFLEKPATPTAEEFADLVQLSREHGVSVSISRDTDPVAAARRWQDAATAFGDAAGVVDAHAEAVAADTLTELDEDVRALWPVPGLEPRWDFSGERRRSRDGRRDPQRRGRGSRPAARRRHGRPAR